MGTRRTNRATVDHYASLMAAILRQIANKHGKAAAEMTLHALQLRLRDGSL